MNLPGGLYSSPNNRAAQSRESKLGGLKRSPALVSRAGEEAGKGYWIPLGACFWVLGQLGWRMLQGTCCTKQVMGLEAGGAAGVSWASAVGLGRPPWRPSLT